MAHAVAVVSVTFDARRHGRTQVAVWLEAGYLADIRKTVERMPREAATAASIIENFPDGHVRDRMKSYDVRPEFRHLLDAAPETVVDMIDGKDSA